MQLRAVRAAKRMETAHIHALHRSLLVWAARPLCPFTVGAVRLHGLEAANAGRACRCAPACSRNHHSARSDVAAGSPDGVCCGQHPRG
eukprot:6358845-Prymnesium_polylepis.1